MDKGKTILQLKIPVTLASEIISKRYKVNKYETNRHIKAVCSYIILKAITPYSIIKNFRLQIGYLAALNQCSKQTMYKRIYFLESLQLLQIEGANIRLNSWKQAGNLFNLNLKEFKTIDYDYTTDKDIFLRLFAVEIEANKERQAYMIKTKLAKNPALKNRIEAAAIQAGADPARLKDYNYLLNAMRLLYKNSFIAEPETHALLCHVRPDCNRSVKKIAEDWSFKSKQSISYYKAKLEAAKIAIIHKGERITSQKRARNEFSHVLWDKRKAQTVLSLVDCIVILQKKQAA